jgi:thiamine-monophosphate kinase
MSRNDTLTLGAVGEVRLIEEFLLPLAREYSPATALGDDCTYIETGGPLVAVTADVGPKPLLNSLPGYEGDLEAAGWLAVVATASDVATAGARPLFLTNCVDAPPELHVNDFIAFMRGYFSASAAFGFQSGGGDVRHGPRLAIRVFGAGVVEHGKRIGRSGSRPGDHLIVLGVPGRFMATYLLAVKADPEVMCDGKLVGEAESILRRPEPQIQAMIALTSNDLVVAASDTSDGLLGAIDNLARSGCCGFELKLDDSLLPASVARAATATGLNPWNIFFSWGDWGVAAVVRKERYAELQDVCNRYSIQSIRLGHVSGGSREVRAQLGGRLVRVAAVRNENFVSYGFNAGLRGHLDHMLSTNLFSASEID